MSSRSMRNTRPRGERPGGGETVETERLLLRPFLAHDLEAYAAMRAKPEVMRFLPSGTAPSVAENRRRALANIQAFQEMWEQAPGYGPWAVVEKESGCVCGHLGLRLLEEFEDRTELLYMLDSAVWGRGYASEGARAAVAFGFETLKLAEIIGLVLPENRASSRVLEKAGMRLQPGLLKIFGLDVALYTLGREDWRHSA
ncbi:MAG: GNAT family N-acetyltransferase [Pseudomonadota bacterium]